MSGQQQATAALGAGLLVVNFWTGEGRQAVNAGILNANPTGADQAAAHAFLVRFGASVLAVAAATILAGISAQWGNVTTAIMLALFVLWLINRNSTPAKTPATAKRTKR